MNPLTIAKEDLGRGSPIALEVVADNDAVIQRFADDIIVEYDAAKASGRDKVVFIFPVGPVGQFELVAARCNQEGRSLADLVGINMDDQSLAGIAVTVSTETAGLGSLAKDDPTWAAQFKGKSIEKPILVTGDGGDINAIGGATITSRAVCKGTMQAIESYNKLKPQLMEKIKETRN